MLAESSAAFALTPAQLQDAQQQNDKIQREQQLQQREDTERSIETGRPQTNIQVPTPQLQKGQGAGCRKIKRIKLLDETHMSKKEEDALVAPYAGKCLGVDQIEKLMSDITSFYINKGFVTTRVYLPAQDLSTGTLKIQVVAGKVSQIKTDEKTTHIHYLTSLFPGLEGNDLNLRDFEQGIDQINRLLSNNATIDIQPGATAGDSIVTINNKPAEWPAHFNATLDNYGPDNTGRAETSMTTSFDNLAGLQDFTSLGLHKSLPLNDFSHQASSDNILISVPWGYSTLTFNFNQSNYDSTITPATPQHLNGDETTTSLTFDHVVFRSQTGKGTCSVSLTNDISNTYIDNQLVTVSSRTLTYVTFGGTYNTQIDGGTATFGGGYSRGLRAMGAQADASGLAGSVPHAQFDKFTLTAGYTRPFSYDQQNFSASSQFSGQYAPSMLYGSQQFSVGGLYSVRGFLDEALANDNGFYLRNDLTWIKSNGAISFRPLVALDIGSVGSVYSGTQNGMLVGAAIGTDLISGPFDFTILGGHPLVRPSSVPDPGYNVLGRVSVTF